VAPRPVPPVLVRHMERISELHDSICNHTQLLQSSNTKLSNCISMHFAGNPLSLSQLGRFLNETTKLVKHRDAFNIGALGGNLIVSIKLTPVGVARETTSSTTTTTPKPLGSGSFLEPHRRYSQSKRGYDDSLDRAREAVGAARTRLGRGEEHLEHLGTHLDVAEGIIANMFREIKGSNGELVFESLGLSVSPSRVIQTNAFQGEQAVQPVQPNFSTRPRLIIACRLSGGIAIPLFTLKRVLSQNGQFLDGMITTKIDSLGPEYRLPLSHLGKEAESKGQQSMLLFLAVPPPPVAPAALPRQTNAPPLPHANVHPDDDESERPTKARRM